MRRCHWTNRVCMGGIISGPYGASDDRHLNPRCTVQFEGACGFVERGAGGHDIVYQQEFTSGNILAAFENPAYVGSALVKRQTSLRGVGMATEQDVVAHPQLARGGCCPGDLGSLIESTIL